MECLTDISISNILVLPSQKCAVCILAMSKSTCCLFSFMVIQYEIKQLWEFIYKCQKLDLPLKARPRALSTWFEIKQQFLYQNENDENWVCGYNPKTNKQYLVIVSHSGFLSNLRKLKKMCEFLAQGQTFTADLNCNVPRRLRESTQQKQF